MVVVFLKEKVVINFNKLHADPKQGKSLDIGMKICVFYRSESEIEMNRNIRMCLLLFLTRLIKQNITFYRKFY